ncbi:MarR family transcriptional regulator [Nitrosopumilus sp.]|nr:MarR family transcriptional regulator [Nitrosopumilus sp.]
MSLLIEPIQSKKSLGEEGILFVRNDSIFDTMVKVPLLVASMIIVAALMPIQSSFSTPRDLDLIIYPDGSTHISTEIDVDPFLTDYEVNLFGSTIDNLVVIGDSGFLLDVDVIDDTALIQTFGSSVITIEYDIHDLVSKQGRLWTFSLDSPSDFTLLLPKNSVIVGMTNLPLNMEIINEQNQLTLSSGSTEIDYFFSINTISSTTKDIVNEEDNLSNIIIVGIIGGIIVIALVSVIIITKNKQKNVKAIDEVITIPKNNILDLETIFKLKPDLREDDKELIKFIFDNNGEALESELRKNFLQPRTTMWRAVKRLEREGVIEIEKKDLQNLVKLRKSMEEDN